MSSVINVQMSSSSNDNVWIDGGSGTNEMQAQTFTPSGDITCAKIEVSVGKGNTSPTDNLTISIQTTSGGYPTGTLVDANATKTIAAASLPANYDWTEFAFPDEFTLSNGTTYAIVAQRSGSRDTDNHFAWVILTTATYAGGKLVSKDSGSWGDANEGGDALFRVYAEGPDVSASDSITVTESVDPLLIHLVSVNESVTVSENNDHTIRDDPFQISIWTDVVTVTEFVDFGEVRTPTPSDNVTVSEYVNIRITKPSLDTKPAIKVDY